MQDSDLGLLSYSNRSPIHRFRSVEAAPLPQPGVASRVGAARPATSPDVPQRYVL